MSPEVRLLTAAALMPAVLQSGCRHNDLAKRALAWADELMDLCEKEPRTDEQAEPASEG